MNSVLAFTIIMLIWTISDFISKKTKSILSSLLIASIIFLIGFKTNIFPEDLLTSSSLLSLGTTIVGFVIVHIGTMISFAELKKQWRTFLIGFAAILGICISLFIFGFAFNGMEYIIASISAVTGGTISVVMFQEAALAAGLTSVAVLPVLITAFQGIIGFPISSIFLKKEAKRLKKEYDNGTLSVEDNIIEEQTNNGKLPKAFQSTAGTLFIVGLVVLISNLLSDLTGGVVNSFIIALILGTLLRSTNIFKSNILNDTDAFGIMMLAILLIIFGPLATMSINELTALITPLLLAFLIGIPGCILFAAISGKLLGYSVPMSITIGLTSLYGFPGTMILSQEASRSVSNNENEIKAIESEILPKMIIAGFSTVTITSVFITSILVGFVG